MKPAIFFIDEIEKCLAGATGYQGDSGVSADQLQVLLTNMNDNEGELFFVCTANDISKLPPEFSRAERFDAVYFLDLPGREEKDAIWNIYLKVYDLAAYLSGDRSERPEDNNWTGAEIKACCRLAAMLGVSLMEAARNVVPVAVTAGDRVEGLRQWASGRCLDAQQAGIYRRNESEKNGVATRAARSIKVKETT